MRIDIKGDIVSDESKWVYDWFGMPCTTPKTVTSALENALKTKEKVDVYINSGGGDIFAGSEIHAALQAHKGEVNIHVVGIAASAASVIACAAHSDISPTSIVMVHNVSSQAKGDYHAMDKESDVLKTANQAMAAAYMQKTGMSEKEALELMDKETWLTAQQAVDLKLIDGITEPANLRLVAAESSVLSIETLDRLKDIINQNKQLTQKCERLKNYITLKEKLI